MGDKTQGKTQTQKMEIEEINKEKSKRLISIKWMKKMKGKRQNEKK